MVVEMAHLQAGEIDSTLLRSVAGDATTIRCCGSDCGTTPLFFANLCDLPPITLHSFLSVYQLCSLTSRQGGHLRDMQTQVPGERGQWYCKRWCVDP